MDLPPVFWKAAAHLLGPVGIYVDLHRSLMDAVLDDDAERVAYWLKAGADVNSTDGEALRQAAGFGYLNSISALLAGGADVHSGHDTALRAAAEHGTIHAADLMLRVGADVHALDDGALIAAVLRDDTDMVSLLLEAGADIHAQREGALQIASWHGKNEMIRLLLANGALVKGMHEAGGHALREAVRDTPENIEKVRLLLAGGADVQAGLDEIRKQQERYNLVLNVIEDWRAAQEMSALSASRLEGSPSAFPAPRV